MFSVENVMGLEEVAIFKVAKLLNIYMREKKNLPRGLERKNTQGTFKTEQIFNKGV